MMAHIITLSQRRGGGDTSPAKYLQAALDVAWNSRSKPNQLDRFDVKLS
jgi:hypothetical protein